VNAPSATETGTAQLAAAAEGFDSIPLQRARLCHFYELALAHPGEDGFDYFRKEATESEFQRAYATLLECDAELLAKGRVAGKAFFARMRGQTYEEIEAAHIALFSANYPHLPCPPYGSLFTATDGDKRLEHMLAIKQFYHQDGVDIADTFTDLPDHLCVELEFAQLLSFRENEMIAKGDVEVLAGIRARQTQFLDNFLLPLSNSLADLGTASAPENLYVDLLETLRCFLLQHRHELAIFTESSSQVQESPS